MYEAYLTKNGTEFTPEIYRKSVHNLKMALMAISPSVYIANTDDRCPTFYFKIKIYKDAFQNSIHQSGKYPEVYRYTLHMDNFDLFVGISRPVVNNTGCVTSLCTRFLKSNLERAISKCRYLTKDLFETVERLREAILREQDLLCRPCTVTSTITSTSTSTSTSNTTSKRHTFERFIYTADIKAFYPSTPHKLILEAYESFNPGERLELRLIKELISFNFITNGTHVYYMGDVGITMGLTLASLLARMFTGHLLRGFTTPLPGPHRLTVYYDDIAATFPLDNPAISNICQTLSPYQLTMTSPNTTQDAIYDVMTGNFRPFCQPFRQPTLLHPHSNQPYSRLAEQTFYSSVYRAVQIRTQPREPLQHLVSVYMLILLHIGHQKTEVIRTLTEMAYFPTARRTSAINQPQPSLHAQIPTIKYCWSDTRPCITEAIHNNESLLKADITIIPYAGTFDVSSARHN